MDQDGADSGDAATDGGSFQDIPPGWVAVERVDRVSVRRAGD
jgi:hypothetical protein